MTELKTLKDLRLEKITRKDWYCDDDYAMSYNTIKAEAVKWVKAAELVKQGEIINCTEEVKNILTPQKDRMCEDLIFLFKYFFNLTEEDLK